MPKRVRRHKPFTVLKNGASASIRDILNLIEGSNVTLTVTEDKPNNKTDVTIASTASGGAGEGNAYGGSTASYEWFAQPRFNAAVGTAPYTSPDGQTAITDHFSTAAAYWSTLGRYYASYTSTTAAGNHFGWNSANGFRISQRGIHTFYIQTGAAITDTRLWIGITDDWSVLRSATSPTGRHVAAFRYIAGTDTNWQLVCNDGGADTGTQVTSSIAVAADTEYKLQVDTRTSGQVSFYINGVLANATPVSTDLPGSTTDLAVICIGTLIAGGATRNLKIARAHFIRPD